MSGRGLVAALALVAAGALPAIAQEEIDLTIASSHPTAIPWVGFMQSVLMPETDRILAMTGNYKINWNEAFGGQLYKANATLTSVEQGITDIGWVFSYLEAPKMPLSQVTIYSPFATNDSELLLEVMTELMETEPAFKEEWEQYNLVFLGATGSDPYDLYTKFPVTRVEDLSGVRLSAPGALGIWLSGLNATPVDGALTTFYTDIQTGVTEGVLSLALGVLPAKLYEVAPYITIANAGVVFSGGVAINRDSFDGLPEEVQEALRAAGKEYSRQHAADLVSRHQAVIDKMLEVGKTQDPPVTLTVLPEEERQKWIDNMPDIASEWVEANEAKGLPARQFMKSYLEALRAKGETPERAWDENL